MTGIRQIVATLVLTLSAVAGWATAPLPWQKIVGSKASTTRH